MNNEEAPEIGGLLRYSDVVFAPRRLTSPSESEIWPRRGLRCRSNHGIRAGLPGKDPIRADRDMIRKYTLQ